MRKKYIIWKAIAAVFLLITCKDVHAVLPLTENLTVSGYVRYELGVHTAEQNPNLPENHDLSLSRMFFQTEWTYQPTAAFKLFALTRIQGDTTYHWDNNLDEYNAFPVDVPENDWTMMKASDDDWRAEVWELYGDLALGDLWLRLGRQQIAWGEMIGGRILDIINPLDVSWNFIFEPEEFEIIRIPTWMIRGIYSLNRVAPAWLMNSSIEAYVNPGDVLPNQNADVGAPFNLVTFPPFLRVNEEDNRGEIEYGVRLGGMIGGFYLTLNYLHVYSDDFQLRFRGFAPDPVFGVPFLAPTGDFTPYAMQVNAEYEQTDVYGVSANYAFEQPWNLVVTFEGTWTPNQPYTDAASALPEIKDQGTWNYAVRFDRNTRILPAQFLSSSYATLQFQFGQKIIEGDEDNVFGAGNSKVDKSSEVLALVVQQPILHNDVTVGMQALYDPDGAYFLKPNIKYVYGNHWYLDIFATFLGGSEDRPGRFGSLSWADTVYGRITFQF